MYLALTILRDESFLGRPMTGASFGQRTGGLGWVMVAAVVGIVALAAWNGSREWRQLLRAVARVPMVRVGLTVAMLVGMSLAIREQSYLYLESYTPIWHVLDAAARSAGRQPRRDSGRAGAGRRPGAGRPATSPRRRSVASIARHLAVSHLRCGGVHGRVRDLPGLRLQRLPLAVRTSSRVHPQRSGSGCALSADHGNRARRPVRACVLRHRRPWQRGNIRLGHACVPGCWRAASYSSWDSGCTRSS